MRLHPTDGLLFFSMKLLKSLDGRETDLRDFDVNAVRNILVVSSTAIGDTLLSTPAIRAVRRSYPEARIIAHFNVRNMELFRNNPDIDGIVPYYGGYRKFFRTIAKFRRYNFDLALIFHGNEPQATPMAYLSGARFIMKVPIPRKYGFLLSNRTNGFDNPWDQHAIRVRLRTASFAGCGQEDPRMVLMADEGDRNFITDYLKNRGVTKENVIVGVQVAAANRYKMWPRENFVELGRRLLSDNRDIRIVLTGSEKENFLCASVAEDIGQGAISTAGELSLKQLGALTKEMDVLVTNDTGIMHMAIALGTKTVSIFCPTNSWGVGAIQDLSLHRIVKKDRACNPCITKKCGNPFCMQTITVNEVHEAVLEHLG